MIPPLLLRSCLKDLLLLLCFPHCCPQACKTAVRCALLLYKCKHRRHCVYFLCSEITAVFERFLSPFGPMSAAAAVVCALLRTSPCVQIYLYNCC